MEKKKNFVFLFGERSFGRMWDFIFFEVNKIFDVIYLFFMFLFLLLFGIVGGRGVGREFLGKVSGVEIGSFFIWSLGLLIDLFFLLFKLSFSGSVYGSL